MNTTDARLATTAVVLAATLVAVSCVRSPVIAPGGFSSSAEGSDAALPPILTTQIPAGAPDEEDLRGLPHGSRIAALDPASSETDLVNLTPGFAAAGRPDVSFDGERVLFVARRAPDDPTGVWEMRVDGTGVREVVRPEGDCEAAIYLSTIFSLDAERPLHQVGFAMRDSTSGRVSLYTCLMDGSNVRQITFAPHGVSDPLLLSDGRLLFSARTPPTSTWYTVNTDGTDVFPFAGQHEPPARRSGACETDDGEVVYVESGGEGGGALAAVSRRRSLTTRRTIATASDERYRSPSPLPNGHLLVSFRAGETFGLYELDPASGKRVARVYDDPAWHEIDAVAVRSRREPPGRSTVVDDTSEVGQLNCLDAYISDTPEGRELARGTLARVRVTSVALPDATGAVVLGEAEVEPDGSFFLDVPARTPLRLETLDEAGEILQAMRSWIWVMPVERRGCIGCHEDREMAPPNRHVLALRKPPQPVGVEPRERKHGGYREMGPE